MKAIRTYQDMTPQLGERVFVDASAVVIGDVWLGDDSSVWPLVTIRGDMPHIRIGARTSVQDGSVLHITHADADAVHVAANGHQRPDRAVVTQLDVANDHGRGVDEDPLAELGGEALVGSDRVHGNS